MQDTPLLLQLTGAPSVVTAPGARPLPLAPPDALMLAWLALEGPTSRERLAALLWPGSETEAARNAMRQRLFRLRKQIGRDAATGTATLALAPDVRHDLDTATGLLGDLRLPEAPEIDTWLEGRRAARRAAARQGEEARIEALEAAGDVAAALPLALALLERDPLSEDAHRRVMRLHYLRGDRAAALLAFDRCEQMLKHEVGAAPAAATLALLATIEQSGTVAHSERVRSAPPAAVLRPPRLVGRDTELAALQRGLGAGEVVVVIGEAGMGKSRLLQALAGMRPGVLHSSGRPGDALVPYATLARALRQVLDRDPAAADPALRRALAPLLPELAEAAEPLPPTQQPLAQPVLALLQRARRSIDTLVLDDLHFADAATLELLQGLVAAPRDLVAARGDSLPRCCLGLRPAATGTPLSGLLLALAAAGPHTRLPLQPLSEAAMAEFVDSLGLPGVSGAALAPVLCQRTGGNPLFALETLKLAWSDGSLGTLAAPGVAEQLPRPDTLAQLIGQQLARLSAPALQLARVAAVAGVDFSIALAAHLLGRSVLDLADPWAELEAQQVLRGESFAHDLVHDAVLQGLPEVIARHLHGQTAAWLETQTADTHAADPARVAAHWEAAGQRARALPALRTAAELAHRSLRENERIGFLLRAADIAEAAERPDEAFDLLRDAIEGHMNTLRQADGLPLVDRLQALARTPLQQALAAGDRAWYSAVLGDFDTAIEQGSAALALAEPLGNEALLTLLRQRLGTALSLTGRFEEALPHMRAAEQGIGLLAAPEVAAEFHGNLAVVLSNLGRPLDAQPHYERCVSISRDVGDHSQLATNLANYASSCLDAGDLALATAQIAQAQRIVSTYELDGSSAGYIATLQAQCERGAGRYATALEWCRRAEDIISERNPSRVPVARLPLAQVWLELGQHARAQQVLGGEALAAARRMPARYAVRWLVLLARLQRRLRLDPSALLAEAATLAPADGWPELRLIVRTEQALAEGPAESIARLLAVADEAQGLSLHGAELGALLHAAQRVREPAQALSLARRATARASGTEALHADRALRYTAPALAWLCGGRRAEAQALWDEGRAWLRTTAAAHVPAEFADSFLHQHPLHRELLGPLPGAAG
ncbi:ATP-binding protein [Rubrivivax rivuli]|uniref:Tetratricopeptide repeat protein n=1 Tax=Rubrivivax rivuli TaxID=1862385 RepID=A0A437RSI9_9BURK|nr:AAA family ATPase [Rubrivivax rivuli]RVU49727.1 tetratricopeptide repeat protein [Rubrivivax rivuli]